MDNLIYSLSGLNCQYGSNDYPVLEISELDIINGEVAFFIGASGVGKSTVLETLGLMNNTISENTNSIFNFTTAQGVLDLSSAWQKGESYLAEIRRQNLSFIFQNTNFFGNLTALENVCISQIIQGKNIDTAKLSAVRLLKKLFGIDIVQEIMDGKKVSELSGGQRQRLAFVRAAVTDCQVLLADEPTGNLDWANANVLMNELVGLIKDSKKTAIIVSHDIPMALKYGDCVVLIEKINDSRVKNRVYGKIDKSTVYRREGDLWENGSQSSMSTINFNTFLKNKLV
jgi:ABC-type lipoprotein export system ATPase subunit|tara:strand:- start:465 stop:1319 length:855 start_codon:yes stop_codon:yes gene_type:complete